MNNIKRCFIYGSILTLTIIPRVWAGPLFIDDAYIYFRYANQFTIGNGLVYNVSEQVLGASSPLYVMLLSSLNSIRINLVPFVWYLNILLQSLTAICLFLFFRKLKLPRLGWITIILFALSPAMITASSSGMETSLLIFLMITSFTLLLHQIKTWAWVCISLVGITRPEGILFVASFIAYQIYLEKRFPFQHILYVISPTILWSIFSKRYYGSWIPHSVIAKSIVYPPNPNWSDNLLAIIKYVTNPLGILTENHYQFIIIMLLCLIYLVGIITISQRTSLYIPLLLWFALISSAYAVTNRYLFPWYLTPFFSIPLFLLVPGIHTMYNISMKYSMLAQKLKQPVFFGGISMLALILSITSINTILGIRYDLEMRENRYLTVGKIITERVGTKYTLATVDIGALGYSYQGKILDLTGLISPESLPFYQSAQYQFRYPHNIPQGIILTYQPEILVAFSTFIGDLVSNSQFQNAYQLVFESQDAHPYYGHLRIYCIKILPERNELQQDLLILNQGTSW